jgi:hypothetical protein
MEPLKIFTHAINGIKTERNYPKNIEQSDTGKRTTGIIPVLCFYIQADQWGRRAHTRIKNTTLNTDANKRQAS